MRGSFSITLMKMVVITSMVVRFTLRAASKKKGLKKVVAKVIMRSRKEGRKVVNISLIILLFKTMVIVLKRKIISEMLVTYFPSFLLMAITFATTFFKPFFFEAGLSVNLTTMLVMTTIFISVMEKLPLTSYPKMIDFWLIFCQLVPFTEVAHRLPL